MKKHRIIICIVWVFAFFGICGFSCEGPSVPALVNAQALLISAEDPPDDTEAPPPATGSGLWIKNLEEIPYPYAPGIDVIENDKAAIDHSNTAEGYVMVMFHSDTDNELRTLIDTPNDLRYTYKLEPGDYAVYPLTEGNGEYTIGVYEQREDLKYEEIISLTTIVSLEDPFAPFLKPNQFVNFNMDSAVVARAAEIAEHADSMLDVVNAVYNYVARNFEYDYDSARSEKLGYVTDVDAVLAQHRGICFDISTVMAAMLRSQGVPTKLVVGYLDGDYHAWLNVFSREMGWVNMAVYFDGDNWSLMDPTFATGEIDYIADEDAYVKKYQY